MNSNVNNYIKLEFLSLSSNEALARTAAAAFSAQLNPTIEELADIRTAVSEAVTNAIVHGYREGIGMVTMECTLEVNRLLSIKIIDCGCGIENIEQAMQPFYTTVEGEERTGMGFAVMEAFMDSLMVESEVGKGTIITMKKKLSNIE